MTSRQTRPAAIVVVGYGSRWHGDDAAGPLVAERLGQRLQHPELQCIACGQLLPELAELVSESGRVLLVDASLSEPAGGIACRRVVADAAGLARLGHQVTAGGVWRLAEAAFGRAARGRLYTIGAAQLGFHQPLSPIVESAIQRLVDRLERKLRGWL